MSKLLSQHRFVAFAAGCLIVFASSDASAQLSGRPPGGTGAQQGGTGTGAGGGQFGGGQTGGQFGGGQTGGGQTGGGQTGGGRTGGGQTGGTRGTLEGATPPGGTQDGQISRSAERVFSDVGTEGRTGGGRRQTQGGGMGAMRGGAMGAMGGMNAFGASPFGSNSAAAQTPSIRTRLRADIATPTQPPQMVTARVQRQLSTAPVQRLVNGFSVSIVGGVATLSGTANSPRDCRMAELVLRLEPGVRQINNQIVVTP